MLQVLVDLRKQLREVTFSDNWVLRPFPHAPALAVCPALSLEFKAGKVAGGGVQLSAPETAPGAAPVKVTVTVAPGVPDAVVRERAARAQGRRKERERLKQRERELEAQRRVQRCGPRRPAHYCAATAMTDIACVRVSRREAENEEARQRRLEAKRAKKAAAAANAANDAEKVRVQVHMQ